MQKFLLVIFIIEALKGQKLFNFIQEPYIPHGAAVTFAEGIESQNVVGYQEITLDAGYNIFAPTFEGVGETMDIQDLKLKNAAGDGTEVIWVLDSNGIATGDAYYWFSKDLTGLDSDCWSIDGSAPLSLEITSGQGFYIYTETGTSSVLVSGQVKVGPYSKALQSGYNLSGNFSPIALDIQQITLTDAAGDGTEVIWVLDSNGIATGDAYYWFSKDLTGLDSDCWSVDGAEVLVKTVEPGEGLYLYTEISGVKINLPAVISAE